MTNALTCVLFILLTGSFSTVTFGFIVNHPRLSRNNVARFQKSVVLNAFDVSGMWPSGLSFGKGEFRFYKSFDSWMSVFSEEDRKAYPEIFNLPKGTYEVIMKKPLGIVFEEIEAGKGVYVQDLVQGGAAERQGIIQLGDVLVGITAIKVVGAKWERRLLPARPFDFDTVIGAISSNEPKWGCDDVVLCKCFHRSKELHFANQTPDSSFLSFTLYRCLSSV
jgi:hypothetical protein